MYVRLCIYLFIFKDVLVVGYPDRQSYIIITQNSIASILLSKKFVQSEYFLLENTNQYQTICQTFYARLVRMGTEDENMKKKKSTTNLTRFMIVTINVR